MNLKHSDFITIPDKELVKKIFCGDCDVKKKGLDCKLGDIHVTTKAADRFDDDRDSFYFTVNCDVNI